MNNSEFDWVYFLRLFKNRATMIGVTLLSTTLVFGLLYLAFPKRFKSASQLTIYSKYFQNPLIKDFISEQYDPSEMRTQREAVIQQALDDRFVDEVGEEFKLFRTPADSPKRGSERADLRKNFEVFSLTPDTYQIGFIWGNADIAEGVAKKTLDQVVQTLVEQRRKTITNVRNAVRARMESMVLYTNSGPKSLGSSSKTQIESQLTQTRAQIAGLLQQYTERHPKVAQLRAREKVLEQYLQKAKAAKGPLAPDEKNGDDLPPGRLAPETLAGSDIESGSKEVYQDLLKKYNYLNVAIDMEKASDVNYYAVISAPSLPLSPFAPKLVNFLGYGLASGILLALFWLLFDELVRFNIVNAERRAKWWGIPLLGAVPSLRIETPGSEPLKDQPGKQPNDWN
jgi:hypothetical protein